MKIEDFTNGIVKKPDPGRGRKRKIEDDEEGGSSKRLRKVPWALVEGAENGKQEPILAEEAGTRWSSDDETPSQRRIAKGKGVHRPNA